MNEFRRFEPKEWERLMHQLLPIRYGIDNYQRVPDSHAGDAGIEGYTFDGDVFQCYVPDEDAHSENIRKNIRTKMRNDIEKLMKNGEKLRRIIGEKPIRRWWFLIPHHRSKELNEEATRLTQVVVSKQLPHISAEFHIMLQAFEDFKQEYDQFLLRSKPKGLGLELNLHPTEDEIQTYKSDVTKLDFRQNIESKAVRLLGSDTDDVGEFIANQFQSHLIGGKLLRMLKDNYPMIYERVVDIKQGTELSLKNRNFLSSGSSVFRETEERFKTRLVEDVSSLSDTDAQILTDEAIADWLGRCNLSIRR